MALVSAISRVRISSADFAEDVSDMVCLLGKNPEKFEEDACACFVLSNATIEVHHDPAGAKGAIAGLVFHAPEMTAGDASFDFLSKPHEGIGGSDEMAIDPARNRGLPLTVEGTLAADGLGGVPSFATDQVSSVDHIVVNTSDGDDIVRLFRDDLGIRLALDQTVEKWGGRMLYFRVGKFTIEVIDRQKSDPTTAPDSFWGIALQTEDIRSTHSRLQEAGVTISEIRTGRKPGTLVATPKSHTLGIPTLLIGPE